MTNFEAFVTTHRPTTKPVASKEDLDALVARVKAAQQKFAGFSQKQVDQIFRSAALAAADARIPLAQLTVQETGMHLHSGPLHVSHQSLHSAPGA